MQNSTWFIIIAIVGVAAALIGYVIAILEGRLTDALEKGREEATPDDAEEKPTLEHNDEHAVLKVSLDSALKWHLELDGVRIDANDLTVEQRTRLVNVVVQIRPWIDGKTAPPFPKPVESPSVATSSPAITSPVSAGDSPVTSPATSSSTSPDLRISIVRGFRTMLENDIKKPEPIKGPSIVGLIDDVLQKKLENSPLAAKKIRLEEGLGGEVIVYVGATRYAAIDDVPDDEIKAIIREAISEWDKQ